MSGIDVLAMLPKTRREVLALIKRRGRVTTTEIAQHLGLTHEGVRAHMVQLQQDGWIVSECDPAADGQQPQSTGRPPTYYCLSTTGDHVFPKQYDELTLLLLDAAEDTELLAKVTDLRVDALRAHANGDSVEDRLDALAAIYLDDDPFVEVVRRDGDWIVIERNCPFLNVAMERPAICSTTVSTLRRLAGYEVVRERRFQDGEARCEFRVMMDRPVRRPKRFELEPPKDAFGVRRP